MRPSGYTLKNMKLLSSLSLYFKLAFQMHASIPVQWQLWQSMKLLDAGFAKENKLIFLNLPWRKTSTLACSSHKMELLYSKTG